TPALSLGERANCRQAVREPSTVRRVKALERIPPLPEGEGRGDGEGDARSTHPILIGPGVRSPPEGFRGSEPFINSNVRLCRRSMTRSILSGVQFRALYPAEPPGGRAPSTGPAAADARP